MFAYAGTREQAERAEQLIRKVAAEHGWKFESELKHWHPTSEQWEDPDCPSPRPTPTGWRVRGADGAERAESEAQGYPEYEVRIQCQTHRKTLELAERLRAAGLPAVHRWRYLLLAAVNQASAEELADRVRELCPRKRGDRRGEPAGAGRRHAGQSVRDPGRIGRLSRGPRHPAFSRIAASPSGIEMIGS